MASPLAGIEAPVVTTGTSFEPLVRALDLRTGCAYALFVYDFGFAIDLNAAERLLSLETTQRKTIPQKRPTPSYFNYSPLPLGVTHGSAPLPIGGFRTDAAVDAVLYDFGAVSVTYRIPLTGRLGELLQLSAELYDHKALLADARRLVELLLEAIRPTVSRAGLADVVEDYVIYQLEPGRPPRGVADVVAEHALPIAQLLRSEPGALSEQEVHDALACQISYGGDDRTLIDWNAALILGAEADDVRSVLEYANVQLLEARFLDDQLDNDLEKSYAAMARQKWMRFLSLRRSARELRRVAERQIDAAVLYEGVNNALKLLGDQYLARVYRLASQRLHLDAWHANIQRKLEILESISQRMSDQQSTWRMEVLEWIIILLFVVSIAITLLPGFAH